MVAIDTNKNNNNDANHKNKNKVHSPVQAIKGDKTEDDVDDVMCESQRCDGPCDLIMEGEDINFLECGHFFCRNCIENIKKEEHTKDECKMKISNASKVRPAKSPCESAYHEGSLSKRASPDEKEKTEKNHREKQQREEEEKQLLKERRKSQKAWYSFSYDNKPVAICMSQSSTFGELLRKLAICLGVNLDTHELALKIQESSSESSEFQNGEPTSLGFIESNSKLNTVRIPKSKMLLVECNERKKESRKKEGTDDTPPTLSDKEKSKMN